MKEGRGVDIVGDLLDREFLDRIAQMKVRSVILELTSARDQSAGCFRCSVEHVPPGGYIIVSGPKSFPSCPDPIDTMFRPTIEEMHKHFPGTEIVNSAIIDSGNWRQWDDRERGRSLARTVALLMVPFHRPWPQYFFEHISAFAIILRKTLIPVPS